METPFARIFLMQQEAGPHPWASILRRYCQEVVVIHHETENAYTLIRNMGMLDVLLITSDIIDLTGLGIALAYANRVGTFVIVFHDGRPGWDLHRPELQPSNHCIVRLYDSARPEEDLIAALEAAQYVPV